MSPKVDRREFLAALGAGTIGMATNLKAQTGETPSNAASSGEAPYNAMGERVGEVTDHSAIVHTHLTALPIRNNAGFGFPGAQHDMPTAVLREPAWGVPKGLTIADLQGACPGKAGITRLHYGAKPNLCGAQVTEWASVDGANDYTHQFFLDDLCPDTEYFYQVETGASKRKTRKCRVGKFRTAPEITVWKPLTIAAITCQHYVCRDSSDGYRTYRSMSKLAPDFMVQTGDNVYYDTEPPIVESIELARFHWHRMQSLPSIMDFQRVTPIYWQKDDHDTFEDDDWPSREAHRVEPLTYAELVPVFREQVPVGPQTPVEPVPYRRFSWGKGIEIWLLESRDFRSPNPAPDGPNKTLWGVAQTEWIKKTVLASDAQFRILFNPTPIVGPDQPGRDYFKMPLGNGDNMADASYGAASRDFRNWVKDNKLTNLIEISGDRHWQYYSVDPDSGLHEFSCGPVSDRHCVAPFHADPRIARFIRFKGGFISIHLQGTEQKPALIVRHHGVDGEVVHEYTQKG